MYSISQNLRTTRKEKGLTQNQLSEASGISRTTITEIESGAHPNTTIFVLCQLCRALEVTPNDLIPKEMYQ